MADHSKPTVTSTYANYTSELDGRLDDLALGLDPATTTPTNVPTNAIRWASASTKWQKWNGSAWGDLSSSYSININGTVGATTPAAGSFTSITNTGGTANGVTYLNGSKVLTSGSALTFDGSQLYIAGTGTTADLRFSSTGYIKGGSNVGDLRILADRFRLYNLAGTQLAYNVDSTGAPTWYISGSEKMRLTSTGLGIGASSPSGVLHLSANTATTTLPSIVLQDTGTTSTRLGSITNNGGDLVLAMTASLTDIRSDVTLYDDRKITFSTAGSERMRLDSAGNLGIGTSSPENLLHLYKASGGVYQIVGNTTGKAAIGVASSGEVTISAESASNPIRFLTSNGSVERLRIDSSGNLLVGTTDTNPSNDSETTGAMVFNQAFGGTLMIRRSEGEPLFLNRTTTDGGIAVFRKNGTTVGSIGSSYRAAPGDSLYFVASDTGIVASPGEDAIVPATTNGATRDNAINLGVAGGRFKDLYLSGGVYVGGTAAANHLDDYEEGTFTPTLIVDSGTPTYQYQEGRYTKIGRYVYGGGIIGINNSGSLIGGIIIQLPFTVLATSYGMSAGIGTDGAGFTWPVTGTGGQSIYNVAFQAQPNTVRLSWYSVSTNATYPTYTSSGVSNTWYMRFNFGYFTN